MIAPRPLSPDLLRTSVGRAILVPLALLIGAFCWQLWPEWSQNPDLSHGFFAPLVCGLLLWESRRHGTPRWLPVGPLLTGGQVALIGAAVGAFILAGLLAASLGWSHALVSSLFAATLVGFLLAGLLLLASEPVRLIPFNWISLTAIALWMLVAPLPTGTYARLTLGLQGWVTSSVLHTLHLLGIPARQHGNVIELATTSVGVEEACSGIRSLLSCLYAGFFFAAWQVRRPLGRAVLIIAAPLLALGMNLLRSLILTLMANAGKDISGFWHDATGFAILGITAVALAGLAILFETRSTPNEPASTDSPLVLPTRLRVIFTTGVMFTLAIGVFYYLSLRPALRSGTVMPDLAAMLPAESDGWQVVTPKDLYQFSDVLQTTHLMERTYLRPTANRGTVQLTVYLAYWPAGQTTVSRVASHTPDACWPGSGWINRPLKDQRETPTLPGLTVSPAEHRFFTHAEGYPQHVWFWHLYDGRAINYLDPYSVPALIKLAWRYGFRRQGDQFFVRVSSNQPWSELAGEPLVREIFSHLDRIGL